MGQGRKLLIDGDLLVAPLVGMLVDIAHDVHVAGRPVPVQGEGHLCPASLRAHLLLTDIMAPAATVDTERAAEHEHVDGGAVGHVGVVPLVDTGTDDNHALATCLLGCGGKGAGRPDDLVGRDSRYLLLPLRGVG